jgi:hypothetical protein
MKRRKKRPIRPRRKASKTGTSEAEIQITAGRKFLEKYRETFRALANSR